MVELVENWWKDRGLIRGAHRKTLSSSIKVAVMSSSVSIVFDPQAIVWNVELLPDHVFVEALGGRSGSHFKTIHSQS